MSSVALIDHLAIGHNLPLNRSASCPARLGRALIIEVVPKSDGQVARLLLSRPYVFASYTQEEFEKALARTSPSTR